MSPKMLATAPSGSNPFPNPWATASWPTSSSIPARSNWPLRADGFGVLWEDLRVALRVSVIGTNYLGATHAAALAEFGHQVIGVDIDVDRVKTLNAGQSHIFEVGLEPLLEKHTSSGRLRFTTDYTEIADWADVHFLALGTPSGPGGAADLSQLHAAIDTLAPLLTEPCLVVGKSTVPVGTAMQLEARLRSSAPAGDAVEVAWNPEF